MEFYRKHLYEEESKVYLLILAGLRQWAECIKIPITTSDSANRSFHAVMADHPELIQATGRWKGMRRYTNVIFPVYDLTEKAAERFDDIMLEIEASAAEFTGTRFEWARKAYLEILRNCGYTQRGPYTQSAWGALAAGHSACRGIAKGFQLWMEAAGIPSICVEGSLDGKTLHVWNIVTIEGSNYHVDVTMGYPQFEFLYRDKGLSYGPYSAFCVSDMTLRKTHSWDAAAMPLKCGKDLEKVPGEEDNADG